MSKPKWIPNNIIDNIEINSSFNGNMDIDMATSGQVSEKNIILYGPPGTGKTYNTINYAVAIIEDKPISDVKKEDREAVILRYQQYKADGLIAFTTFHQSFSYEDFIEGIRPVFDDDDSGSMQGIKYEIKDGIFKAFCNNAEMPIPIGTDDDFGIRKNPTIWKVSLEKTGENPTRSECMENSHIRIGFDEHGEDATNAADDSKMRGKNILNAFYNVMQIGDIVMSCYSSRAIDAIGVITGEPEWDNKYTHYKRVRKVKWLAKGINKDIVSLNADKALTLSTIYRLSLSMADVIEILKEVEPNLFANADKIKNRVFIIDEINRGNISKIFGELITLIESNKRIGTLEELKVKLPYSHKDFGVPNNVYIIGTMNTADRSLALLDTALRRRFSFIPVYQDSSLLKDKKIDGIDIKLLLDTINMRISSLYDQEHCIGHSYFLNIIDFEQLKHIFENNILPLLEEYFFERRHEINFILGDAPFLKLKSIDQFLINKGIDISQQWEIDKNAFDKKENYIQIYSSLHQSYDIQSFEQ